MIKNLMIGGFAFILMLSLLFCFERIDAGHEGIRVNLYGDNKGVDNVTAVTGMVWYNPLTTMIFEVPTFVQNAVYTRINTKDSGGNEEFRVTTKNGLVVGFDVSINYYTPAGNVVDIFKKYRKPVKELEKTIVKNYLRDAFNGTAAKYTASQLYEKRNEFQQESEDAIKEMLNPEGFVIEQVVLLNELRLPQSVVNNIEAKVNATQMALRKQEELAQAEADAQKIRAKAQGEADALRIQADAEKYAFEQKQKALTKLLVQQQMIEKWNGKLPVYGQVPELFKTIQN